MIGVGLVEDGRTILDDLSFELAACSTNCLVGSTTEIRSTLFTLILGLETPARGTVHLDGIGVEEMSLPDRRSAVTLAVTDPWLVPGTIAENIAFGYPTVSRDRVEEAASLACLDSFTDELARGLDTALTEEGPELTPAQRRLVGLARAVVRQPALILIDQPATHLDDESESVIDRAVQQVSKGRTTLVAAHRPQLVKRADRILRVRDGRLVESDTRGSTSAPNTDWVNDRAIRRLDSTQSVLAIQIGDEFVPGHQAINLMERSAHTETWLAWDRGAGRSVQVKLPRRSPATFVALEELTREFRTGELLSHPGLGRPLYAQFALARPYSVYEHLQGPTLADLIRGADDRPDPALVLRVGHELCRTLSYIHQRGFAHLDLRPEIVVVSPQGTVVTDLKMALRLGDEQVRFYRRDQYGVLAAEQLRGGPAAASMDIFALGALLYQAANGVLATNANSNFGARRASIESRPPRRRPPGHLPGHVRGGQDLTVVVASIVEQLTASDPKLRPTAEEAIALIRPHLMPSPASPGAIEGPATSWISAATGQVAS